MSNFKYFLLGAVTGVICLGTIAMLNEKLTSGNLVSDDSSPEDPEEEDNGDFDIEPIKDV